MCPEMIRAPQGKRKQNVNMSSALIQVKGQTNIQAQQVTSFVLFVII